MTIFRNRGQGHLLTFDNVSYVLTVSNYQVGSNDNHSLTFDLKTQLSQPRPHGALVCVFKIIFLVVLHVLTMSTI